MGIPSDSSSDDPKQKIVMGYPSMDRYHHAQQMHPHPPSAHPPPPPQGYASSQFQHPPQGYASSSFQPGYPAAPPYPQLPQGYHDPSAFQHDGKYLNPTPPNPYIQPPYNDYYYQQHYKPLMTETSKNSSFGRLMLILMIVLVASMCMMSLVMWFLFGTYIPEFEATSIKVSNFSATNTTLTGIWKAGISVTNTNKELAISFDHVLSSIFYKDALLGISSLQPFQVQKLDRFDLNYSMPVEESANDRKFQSWVLPALAQDLHTNRVLIFSLRLAMKANFTAPNIVYKQESLRVLCENVQINFSPTGEGTLTPVLGNTCLIRLHDGLRD